MPSTARPADRTSVTYTRPASTSPVRTTVSTDFTSVPSVTGWTDSFAAARTFTASAPHGTWGAHTATFTPGRTRSASAVICAGSSGGTATSSTWRANVPGFAASPADTTWFMLVGLAGANTSAGAPLMICWASPELGPKSNRTVVPGYSAWNWLPSRVNASVSEAAARTVIVPCGPVAVEPPAAGWAAGLAEPHPASSTATAASPAAACAQRACARRLARRLDAQPAAAEPGGVRPLAQRPDPQPAAPPPADARRPDAQRAAAQRAAAPRLDAPPAARQRAAAPP